MWIDYRLRQIPAFPALEMLSHFVYAHSIRFCFSFCFIGGYNNPRTVYILPKFCVSRVTLNKGNVIQRKVQWVRGFFFYFFCLFGHPYQMYISVAAAVIRSRQSVTLVWYHPSVLFRQLIVLCCFFFLRKIFSIKFFLFCAVLLVIEMRRFQFTAASASVPNMRGGQMEAGKWKLSAETDVYFIFFFLLPLSLLTQFSLTRQ